MKTRIISGAVGVIVLAAVIYFRNIPYLLNIVLALLSAIAAHELFAAKGFASNKPLSVLGTVAAALPLFLSSSFLVKWGLLMIFVYVLLLFLVMMKYKDSLQLGDIAFAFASSLLLPTAFSCLIGINNFKETLGGVTNGDVLFFIILSVCGAWIADTGAYFTGMLLGKHKLAPVISPKKTIEGFVGGIVFNMLVFALAGFIYTRIDSGVTVNYLFLLVLGALSAVIGCIGDLSASVIKRKAGIKDYGKIMPGHGGVMDRFDSFLMVVPMMYIVINSFWSVWPLILRG